MPTRAPYINKIDRKCPIPLYVQLKAALFEHFEAFQLKPGDSIPSETALCDTYGVSRTVVRQALQDLEHEGVIIKEKGRNAYIAEPKIVESLVQKLTGFHQDMTSMGYDVRSQILEQTVESPGPKIVAELGIEPSRLVIKITRLRFVNQEPIVLVTTYLPHEKCQGVEKADLSHRSLYALLEKEYGIVIAHGKRTIQAAAANEYEAKLLNQKPGVPLIVLDSVSCAAGGVPIEYYHALHRADRSKFTVELVRIQTQGERKISSLQDFNEIPSSHEAYRDKKEMTLP
jgi:GntR family transcriptional regulator